MIIYMTLISFYLMPTSLESKKAISQLLYGQSFSMLWVDLRFVEISEKPARKQIYLMINFSQVF